MPGPKVEIVLDSVNYLGEGPHWCSQRQQLYFVDIFRQHVYRYDPSNKTHSKAHVDGGPVSFIVPVQDKKDKFMISRGREICVMDWNGSDPAPAKVTSLKIVEDDSPTNRFNDAKCDASGRLWAGTMGSELTLGNLDRHKGALYSLDKDMSIRKHFDKIDIGNGLAWNSSNNIMYYIDSLTYRVDAFDFDLQKGVITNRRPVFDLKSAGIDGIPDGMAIDTNGKLWVANFKGSRIINVDPEVGKITGKIELPCSHITSVSFGGPHLDIMYVTSAQHFLTLDEIGREPAAGSLFQVTGTGARGMPGVDFTGIVP